MRKWQWPPERSAFQHSMHSSPKVSTRLPAVAANACLRQPATILCRDYIGVIPQHFCLVTAKQRMMHVASNAPATICLCVQLPCSSMLKPPSGYLLDLLRLPPVNAWGPPGWEVLPRSSEQAQGQGYRPKYSPVFCIGKHKSGFETHVAYPCRERRCCADFASKRRGARGPRPGSHQAADVPCSG